MNWERIGMCPVGDKRVIYYILELIVGAHVVPQLNLTLWRYKREEILYNYKSKKRKLYYFICIHFTSKLIICTVDRQAKSNKAKSKYAKPSMPPTLINNIISDRYYYLKSSIMRSNLRVRFSNSKLTRTKLCPFSSFSQKYLSFMLKVCTKILSSDSF